MLKFCFVLQEHICELILSLIYQCHFSVQLFSFLAIALELLNSVNLFSKSSHLMGLGVGVANPNQMDFILHSTIPKSFAFIPNFCQKFVNVPIFIKMYDNLTVHYCTNIFTHM